MYMHIVAGHTALNYQSCPSVYNPTNLSNQATLSNRSFRVGQFGAISGHPLVRSFYFYIGYLGGHFRRVVLYPTQGRNYTGSLPLMFKHRPWFPRLVARQKYGTVVVATQLLVCNFSRGIVRPVQPRVGTVQCQAINHVSRAIKHAWLGASIQWD